jgi:peptidoglycan lytic transglycosylase
MAGALPVRAASVAASAELRVLASKARARSAWASLLRYAQSAKDPEQRGLAYFVLAYREFDADIYAFAIKNFGNAAETNFSFSDYARYYQASTAQEAGQPDVVLEALADFSTRYPESLLREDALELYARTALDAGQPQRALDALVKEPRVRQQPSLALLLASAYQKLNRPDDAARAYEEIYYAFPTSFEAKAAGKALEQLRAQLNGNLPRVSDEIQTARADKLYQRSRYDDALKEYTALIENQAKSPLVPRWKLGRARCLYRLRRTSEALDELQQPFSGRPQADSDRLGLLVDIYVRQDDPDAMDTILDQLGKVYPSSLAYASALDSAGDYFVRQGDWKRAARYYEPLATSFPDSDWAQEASWRVAWSWYLQRDSGRARQAFEDYLKRYPESWHAPAALYWLGRLAEENGAMSPAEDLYQAIGKRFGHSYYAVRARLRLSRLSQQTAQNDPTSAAAWLQVVTLAGQVPPLAPPPFSPCSAGHPSEELNRFRVLRSLSLDDLAEQYLRTVLSNQPERPELLLALSRFEMQRGERGKSLLDAVKVVDNYSEFEFDALPKEVWDLLYPRTYWNLVRREAAARGLDPYLVMGLIRQESAFNPHAVSVANARGLMQILPQTVTPRRSHRRWAARRLMSPSYNVRVGTNYLRRLSAAFDGDQEQTLAAYHAGQSRVSAWVSEFQFRDPAEFLESIPIPSTRVYVERVLRDSGVYRQLLTGKAEFADCRLRHGGAVGVEPARGRKKIRKAGRAVPAEASATAAPSPVS